MSEAAQILFVDDEKPILNSLKRLFRPTGHKVHIAQSGAEGLNVLGEHTIDIVVSDMRMPEMDGAEFLTNVASKWPATTRMLLTGYADLTSAIDAINNGAIARYLTKPWQDDDIVMCVQQAIDTTRLAREKARLEALTAKQNAELKELNESLEAKVAQRTQEIEAGRAKLEEAHSALSKGYRATINIFSRVIQARAGLTSRAAVAEDARAVGARLGLSDAVCEALADAALLCDIGKISLPDDIVSRPYTLLGPNEARDYHRHPTNAEATLLSLEPLAPAAAIIRQHCERVDGSGFPAKLTGDEIALPARVLAVVKAYADLQRGGMFKEWLTARDAREFLIEHKGQRYDETVVDAFIEWLDNPDRSAAELKERKLKLAKVHPGMITTRDLCDANGVLVLASGQEISSALLDRLETLQRSLSEPLTIFVKSDRK